MKILKALIVATLFASVLSITSFADEFGTKEEAATLLERAVALVLGLKPSSSHCDFAFSIDVIEQGLSAAVEKKARMTAGLLRYNI